MKRGSYNFDEDRDNYLSDSNFMIKLDPTTVKVKSTRDQNKPHIND